METHKPTNIDCQAGSRVLFHSFDSRFAMANTPIFLELADHQLRRTIDLAYLRERVDDAPVSAHINHADLREQALTISKELEAASMKKASPSDSLFPDGGEACIPCSRDHWLLDMGLGQPTSWNCSSRYHGFTRLIPGLVEALPRVFPMAGQAEAEAVGNGFPLGAAQAPLVDGPLQEGEGLVHPSLLRWAAAQLAQCDDLLRGDSQDSQDFGSPLSMFDDRDGSQAEPLEQDRRTNIEEVMFDEILDSATLPWPTEEAMFDEMFDSETLPWPTDGSPLGNAQAPPVDGPLQEGDGLVDPSLLPWAAAHVHDALPGDMQVRANNISFFTQTFFDECDALSDDGDGSVLVKRPRR
jgi:hypothetical protein